MFALAQLPSLLAADNRLIKLDLPSFGTQSVQIPGMFLLVLGLIVASYLIGFWFANTIRMKDYGWKVGLILATSEEPQKALQPALFGVAVPAALYLIGWIWERLRRKP